MLSIKDVFVSMYKALHDIHWAAHFTLSILFAKSQDDMDHQTDDCSVKQ